ncbi:MAG: HAD family phosphatase [Anaerolineae bacterium]|nr:HAD family phosphatase [Thermoflexales bacterium]MDW8407906.1 HAD family phosphatase [Anaerolineae bacterium]
MSIQAVLFDIGGVLLRTEDQEPRRRWERKLGLPARALADAVFNCETAILASVGQATQQDVWRAVAERFHLDDAKLRDLQRDFWAGDRLDEQLVSYLTALRPRYKTGLLSNAWLGLRALYAQWFGLTDDLVDVIIYSGEVGMMKPDARIYHLALERLKAPAEAVVFVDDVLENVRGAQAVGMRAVQFISPAQTLAALADLLSSDRT